MIVVTLNYRLGVLGFLAHPELSAESLTHVSGNYGVQDQVAALAWVNRNIAKFGGDPGNVTVFGQSAGAISTANLITVPEARKYFKRAILQSGTPFGVGELPHLDESERGNAEFGSIIDLRSQTANDVLARWNRFAAASPSTRKAIPIVDGVTLRRQPAEAFLAGEAKGVPLLVGSVVREIPPVNRDDLVQTARRILGPSAEKALTQYEQRGADRTAGDPGTQMMTDMLFRCGTMITAEASDRSWLFHFFEDFPERSEPAHSAEVFYVFQTRPRAQEGPLRFTDAQQRLANLMDAYWTNFAKTGDPNSAGLPSWPSYSRNMPSHLELAAAGVRTAGALRADQCGIFLDHWTNTYRHK